MEIFGSRNSDLLNVKAQLKLTGRPRLLNDYGPCYISRELKRYLEKQEIQHIRTKVYHLMTQGKIKRYHRYHEAIDNVTPADKYYGRDIDVLRKREKVRKQTMKLRRKLDHTAMLQTLPNGIS